MYQKLSALNRPCLIIAFSMFTGNCECGTVIDIDDFAKNNRRLQFLPRDALLSAVYAVVVCLCVCHTPVLDQNG